MCDNLINALKLSANPQKDGDSLGRMIAPAGEKSAQQNGRAQVVYCSRVTILALDLGDSVMIDTRVL